MSDRGALRHSPERRGRIGATLKAVTAKTLKRFRSETDRRRRGVVSSGHLASLPNRCFTSVRQNPSRRRTVRPAAEGPFFHGLKRSAEPTASLRRAPTRATATARAPIHVRGIRTTPHRHALACRGAPACAALRESRADGRRVCGSALGGSAAEYARGILRHGC